MHVDPMIGKKSHCQWPSFVAVPRGKREKKRGPEDAEITPPTDPSPTACQVENNIPLILYSPVSWLLLLRMLNAGDALDPTVSTLSNPGCAGSVVLLPEADEPGRWFSSCWRAAAGPGRRANGLRIGIVALVDS
jgi:hypothetical protein